MTIEQAIEVFVRGFAFTRGFTHPYLAEKVHAGVWVMRDAPRRSGDYRTEEYVAYGVEPAALDALARRHTHGRYRICVIRAVDEPDEPIRMEFKALGYRLMTTEPFFVHHLTRIEPVEEPFPIVQVTTTIQADMLKKETGRRQILPEHLDQDPPPMRQYMAMDGDRPIGWVASIAVAGCAWCSNMEVQRPYRRQGVARSLLTRMLQDDRIACAQANFLLATHTGAKLYPTVGYETIGELLMFAPPRNLS